MRDALLDRISGIVGDAVIVEGRTVSGIQLHERARALAERIAQLVPSDHRVGLIDTHDEHGLVSLLGCLLAGRSIAMLGVGERTPDTDLLAARARCAIVLVGAELAESGFALVGDEAGPSSGLTADESPEAVVLFTSGTTGQPKGVRLSRANVLANLTAMQRISRPWDADDRLGQVLTITHSFGLSMALMALAWRTPIVLLPTGAPSRALSEQLAGERVTTLACVPYFLRLMSRRGIDLGGPSAPHVRRLFLAGGGLADDEIDQLLPELAGELYLMYGFTETTARAAVRRHGDGAPSGSVGLPLPGTSIQIVDEAGLTVPPGYEGLIRATGPSLMIGYLGEPPRLRGAPFTTTDLGRLDEAGNLFITGREIEMMNFRGNRVSIVRLEALAMRVDGVLDARAVPDSRAEDAQCTLRLVASPDADRSAVKRGVAAAVEPRGIVRAIVFVADLPKTRSGKAIRYAVE